VGGPPATPPAPAQPGAETTEHANTAPPADVAAGLPAASGPRDSPAPRATPPPPRPASSGPPASTADDPQAASAGGADTGLSSCSLAIVTQPAGATVYLDDELIGTTDPEWGRLVRSGIASGRHRVRLALAGYQELTEEVDLREGASRELRRRLSPLMPAPDRRPLIFGAVALVLVGLTVWALRRPRPDPRTSTPLHPRFVDTPLPGRLTPPFASPGVRRTEDGAEYFGEYRLIQRLGRGGMATVYKAERRGEISALKRPLPAFLEEPQFLERFQREAEIGRALHHPNIVRILERGAVEEVPYFTMELVPGETLQAHLQHTGALEARMATGIVVQVAEALDYAHLKGVVHRDLKPSNVMVLEDGTAKVMDYGIARARRFEGMTVTGSFLGSPEYVAPEAIEGKGTDARSDLYSLGVMFYETLTGRRPFQGETPFAVLRMHLTEAPPAPSLLVPGLPPQLEKIVLRLLDKLPDHRYAAADELVLELRDFLNRAAWTSGGEGSSSTLRG